LLNATTLLLHDVSYSSLQLRATVSNPFPFAHGPYPICYIQNTANKTTAGLLNVSKIAHFLISDSSPFLTHRLRPTGHCPNALMASPPRWRIFRLFNVFSEHLEMKKKIVLWAFVSIVDLTFRITTCRSLLAIAFRT